MIHTYAGLDQLLYLPAAGQSSSQMPILNWASVMSFDTSNNSLQQSKAHDIHLLQGLNTY